MTVATATASYVIRYRFDGAHQALLVQDSDGDAYIVGADGLTCRFSGACDFPALEPTLRGLGWVPVPRVSPYRLEELQRLLVPAS